MKRKERTSDGIIIEDAYDIQNGTPYGVSSVRESCSSNPDYKNYLMNTYHSDHTKLTVGEKYVLTVDFGMGKKSKWDKVAIWSNYVDSRPVNLGSPIIYSSFSNSQIYTDYTYSISELEKLLSRINFQLGYHSNFCIRRNEGMYYGYECIYYNSLKRLILYMSTQLGTNFVKYPCLYGYTANLIAFNFIFNKLGTGLSDFIYNTERSQGFAKEWPKYSEYSSNTYNHPRLDFVNEKEETEAKDMGLRYPDSDGIAKRKILLSNPEVIKITRIKE